MDNAPVTDPDSDPLKDLPQLPAYSDLSQKGNSPNSGSEEKVMSVVEHLDELRVCLIRSICYMAAGVCVGLFLAKRILRFLEAPAGNITIQSLSVEEPLVALVKVACYCGLIIASPFVLLEIGQFVSPGLTKRERRMLAPIVFGSPVLFIGGAAFAYYLLLPSMLHFFGSFGQDVSPINQRLDFYISLVSSILLYMGLCFQLPIVIFALSFTGLVSSKLLLSVCEYAVFAASVVAAVITPDPTAFSMILVALALSALYFISIALLKVKEVFFHDAI